MFTRTLAIEERERYPGRRADAVVGRSCTDSTARITGDRIQRQTVAKAAQQASLGVPRRRRRRRCGGTLGEPGRRKAHGEAISARWGHVRGLTGTVALRGASMSPGSRPIYDQRRRMPDGIADLGARRSNRSAFRVAAAGDFHAWTTSGGSAPAVPSWRCDSCRGRGVAAPRPALDRPHRMLWTATPRGTLAGGGGRGRPSSAACTVRLPAAPGRLPWACDAISTAAAAVSRIRQGPGSQRQGVVKESRIPFRTRDAAECGRALRGRRVPSRGTWRRGRTGGFERTTMADLAYVLLIIAGFVACTLALARAQAGQRR